MKATSELTHDNVPVSTVNAKKERWNMGTEERIFVFKPPSFSLSMYVVIIMFSSLVKHTGVRLFNSASHSDQAFVVFGAGLSEGVKNIGGALAERLVDQHDGKVIIVGRSEDKLKALASELGDRVEYYCVDAVNDPKNIDHVFKNVGGPIAGVANCIGSVLLKPAHSTSEKEFHDTMQTNTMSSFNILKSAVKVMMRQEHGGSIAFCASAVAQHGIQNHEAIAAAKGAIVSMSKSAASTYAPKNIRINCVAPGLIETPMTQKICQNPAARKASESMHALKRLGKPEDVASALEFFLNPRHDFVTGQVLGVCGGLSSIRAQ